MSHYTKTTILNQTPAPAMDTECQSCGCDPCDCEYAFSLDSKPAGVASALVKYGKCATCGCEPCDCAYIDIPSLKLTGLGLTPAPAMDAECPTCNCDPCDCEYTFKRGAPIPADTECPTCNCDPCDCEYTSKYTWTMATALLLPLSAYPIKKKAECQSCGNDPCDCEYTWKKAFASYNSHPFLSVPLTALVM